MKTPEEIGKIVRELRGEQSLRDFAEKCGVAHSTIDTIEKGFDFRTNKPVNPSVVVLNKIADAAGVPLSYITDNDTTFRFGDNSVDEYASFSLRLRQLLKKHNMKAAELSRITGIDRSVISCYASGRYEPKGERLFLIARALRVSPQWLSGQDVPIRDDCAENASSFSQRLKIALKNKNMKQSQLADVLNVDRSYITNWINGKYRANEETKKRIANVLGVSIAWLSGYDVTVEPAEPACAPHDRLDELLLSMFNKLSLAHQEEVIKYINNLSSKEN